MTAARIVPAFDEVKHREPSIDLRPEPLAIQQLTLEGREEALAQGVVVRVADAAHGRPDPRLPAPTTKAERGVLAAAVGVMNHLARAALREGHVESGQDDGVVNPDQALSNSDSYSMFLNRRASSAITPGSLPVSDPVPTGFASTAQADKATRAVALAQVWTCLAAQGLTDLHGALRNVGTGNPLPPNLGDPRRLDRFSAR
jgi:hypothetical protein